MSETAIVAKKDNSLRGLLESDAVKKRFNSMLGKKAPGFISSIISAHSMNRALAESDPGSIIAAAAVAASLDLPINPSLGMAHIVPYKGVAQFQIGYKGLIQLGMRSGQYKTMNAAIVYEGEIKSRNRITGDMEFNPDGKTNDKIVGFVFFFRLINGFEKYYYMTLAEIEAHGKRYAQSYDLPNGNWKKRFNDMALKTVVKLGLGKWGVLSIEMQKAMTLDGAAIKEDGTPDYIDSTSSPLDENAPPKFVKPVEIVKPATPPNPSEPGGPIEIVLPESSYIVASGNGMVSVEGQGGFKVQSKNIAVIDAIQKANGKALSILYWPGDTNEIEQVKVLRGAATKA